MPGDSAGYPSCVADLKQRVAERIDAMRPYLDRSGGQIELVGVEDNIARIKLWLTRPGPSRLVMSLQLKSGIERLLRNDIPELRGVEAVNLPPFAELGWDQSSFVPVEMPIGADGAAPKPEAPKT
jgi:Fe-S cluster biogenesis protein NfuA